MAEGLSLHLEGSNGVGEITVRKYLDVGQEGSLLLDSGITLDYLDIKGYGEKNEVWFQFPSSTGLPGVDDQRFCEPHLQLTFFIKEKQKVEINVMPSEAVIREVKLEEQTSILEVSPNAEVTISTPWAKVAKTVIKVS